MNLSKEKIKSLILNVPQQANFLLKRKFDRYLVPDHQVFISPYGLGDTFLLCLFSPEWEKQNNKKIHFFIKPSHKFILEFFKVDNFSTVDINEFPLYFLGIKNCWKNIGQDKLFVAHMLFHIGFRKNYSLFNRGQLNLENLYENFFNVKKNNEMSQIFLKSALEHANNVDVPDIDYKKTIFINPTANTIKTKNDKFWSKLRTQVIHSGYDILENSKEINLYRGTDIKRLDLNLKDLISVGFRCHKNITLRSGVSDFFHLKRDSIVVYPDNLSLKQFSVNNMYDCSNNELVMSKEMKTDINKIINLISN